MGDSEASESDSPAPLECREVVELITTYLEGAMTADDRARFEHHLSVCPNCVAYLDQMRRTITAVGKVSEADIAPARREELVSLFRNWRNP